MCLSKQKYIKYILLSLQQSALPVNEQFKLFNNLVSILNNIPDNSYNNPDFTEYRQISSQDIHNTNCTLYKSLSLFSIANTWKNAIQLYSKFAPFAFNSTYRISTGLCPDSFFESRKRIRLKRNVCLSFIKAGKHEYLQLFLNKAYAKVNDPSKASYFTKVSYFSSLQYNEIFKYLKRINDQMMLKSVFNMALDDYYNLRNHLNSIKKSNMSISKHGLKYRALRLSKLSNVIRYSILKHTMDLFNSITFTSILNESHKSLFISYVYYYVSKLGDIPYALKAVVQLSSENKEISSMFSLYGIQRYRLQIQNAYLIQHITYLRLKIDFINRYTIVDKSQSLKPELEATYLTLAISSIIYGDHLFFEHLLHQIYTYSLRSNSQHIVGWHSKLFKPHSLIHQFKHILLKCIPSNLDFNIYSVYSCNFEFNNSDVLSELFQKSINVHHMILSLYFLIDKALSSHSNVLKHFLYYLFDIDNLIIYDTQYGTVNIKYSNLSKHIASNFTAFSSTNDMKLNKIKIILFTSLISCNKLRLFDCYCLYQTVQNINCSIHNEYNMYRYRNKSFTIKQYIILGFKATVGL